LADDSQVTTVLHAIYELLCLAAALLGCFARSSLLRSFVQGWPAAAKKQQHHAALRPFFFFCCSCLCAAASND